MAEIFSFGKEIRLIFRSPEEVLEKGSDSSSIQYNLLSGKGLSCRKSRALCQRVGGVSGCWKGLDQMNLRPLNLSFWKPVSLGLLDLINTNAIS